MNLLEEFRKIDTDGVGRIEGTKLIPWRDEIGYIVDAEKKFVHHHLNAARLKAKDYGDGRLSFREFVDLDYGNDDH